MNISGKRTNTDTPCIGVCSTTALGDSVCKGCRRTADEVMRWNIMPDKEKSAINDRLRKNQGGL